jgi:hypothetical protein
MSVLVKDLLTLRSTASVPDSSRSAVRSALVAAVLRRRGHLPEDVCLPVRLRVHGESMLPTLWPGDVVEIASCSLEDVRPGAIVLALRDGRLFLHRLVATQPNGFVLRGDSMPGPDPLFPPEALLGRLVSCAGKEVASRFVSGHRLSDAATASNEDALLGAGHRFSAATAVLRLDLGAKCSRAIGMLLCHCGVARRLALKLHRRKASAHEFQNPEPAGALTSAELGL